jgi:hypothetical protein
MKKANHSVVERLAERVALPAHAILSYPKFESPNLLKANAN